MSRMNDTEWNSVTVEEEEKPRVGLEELRGMVADLDPEDFDEPVQEFLSEVMVTKDVDALRPAATLLLQDEIDLSPDLAEMGVEPDEGLIELLLAMGADVDARNPYGQPPLHLAAYYGYERIVEMLLAAGASLTRRNKAGQYAAEVAATPALAAKLEPPYRPDLEEMELPPEVEDADDDPEGEHHHGCCCGHEHDDEAHECCCGQHGHAGEVHHACRYGDEHHGTHGDGGCGCQEA